MNDSHYIYRYAFQMVSQHGTGSGAGPASFPGQYRQKVSRKFAEGPQKVRQSATDPEDMPTG